MEELQKQIDEMRLEIEELKSRCANAFCADEVKVVGSTIITLGEELKAIRNRSISNGNGN